MSIQVKAVGLSRPVVTSAADYCCAAVYQTKTGKAGRFYVYAETASDWYIYVPQAARYSGAIERQILANFKNAISAQLRSLGVI